MFGLMVEKKRHKKLKEKKKGNDSFVRTLGRSTSGWLMKV